MSEYIVRMPPDMPYEIRAELNAWYVESEPIVRCRDCKHRRDWTINELDGFDEARVADGWCRFIRIGVDDVDYCAWGVPVEEFDSMLGVRR